MTTIELIADYKDVFVYLFIIAVIYIVFIIHQELNKKPKMNEKIYAVMVESRNSPTKVFSNYEDALIEAKRLALKERLTAYVLVAITKLELNELKITQL